MKLTWFGGSTFRVQIGGQVVAIDPGHDGWVVGNEPVVMIEFDFERDTVRKLGMPASHSHE